MIADRTEAGTSGSGDTAASSAVMAVIRTMGLEKRYGSTTALAGLTLTVEKGEVFGFLGPNGAGKTTAVKLLVGLAQPTGGEGWLLDAPIGDVSVRRRIGYMPELFRYQDWLTASEVLRLHCRLAKVRRNRHASEIARAVELAGLLGRENDRVGKYSKGMQQRLGLGAALLGRPEVVFLDEPTSALDPVGRHDVREIIRALKAEGTTVFLNSHLLTEVEQVCDRVAVVDKGRVIAMGTVDEIRGAGHTLRIRARGIDAPIRARLAEFGPIGEDNGALIIQGIRPERVPEVVRILVERNCPIYSVQPGGDSLEDAFLHLLGREDDGVVDDRIADIA